MHKSALVVALLFPAFSCANVIAAETVPANSQIYKEAKSLSKVPANSKVFTGKAEVIPMSQQIPGMPVHNGIVIFEPGARTFWHIHPAGQFFTVLRGEGRTGVYGEKARVVKPGDVVICPAGVKHFHGAGPDTQMVQMTVTWRSSMKAKVSLGSKKSQTNSTTTLKNRNWKFRSENSNSYARPGGK